MSEDPRTARVDLVLLGDSPDAREIEDLTTKLRNQLLELEVDAVERGPETEAPEGTRGVGSALGLLLVRLVTSSELLGAVVTTIRGWLSGHGNRTVKITLDGDTLELTGVSSSAQDQLIQTWISRHAGASKARRS